MIVVIKCMRVRGQGGQLEHFAQTEMREKGMGEKGMDGVTSGFEDRRVD
jgi:hypothetical protein